MNRQKDLQDFFEEIGEPKCSNCGEYFESTRDTHQHCETCKRCVYSKHEGQPCSEVLNNG